MAVAYTSTILGYTYGFDFVSQRIDVDHEVVRMQAVNLYRAIQDAQASVVGIAFPHIAEGEGLTRLSEGVYTYITVILLESWKVNSLQVTGSFEAIGGNVVRADGDFPFLANPLIFYVNTLSQAGIHTMLPSLGGLSTEQNNKLMGLPSVTLTPAQEGKIDAVVAETAAISAAQDDQLTEDRFVDLTFNKSTTITGTAAAKKISGYVAGTTDQVEVAVTYDEEGQYGLPETEGVV